jgi:hypothetical protein
MGKKAPEWGGDAADRLFRKLWNDGISLRAIAPMMVKAGFVGVTKGVLSGRKARLRNKGFKPHTNRLTWTAAADAMFRGLWNKGLSFRLIAIEMTAAGYRATRSSLGSRKRDLKNKGFNARVRQIAPPKPSFPVVKFSPTPVFGDAVPFVKNNGCRAIMSGRGPDGLALCCGRQRCHDSDGLTSYCREHYQLYINRRLGNGEAGKATGSGNQRETCYKIRQRHFGSI